MRKILIVAQFTQLPGENGNNRSRFKYLCEKLSEEGYSVTQVTSSFRDLDKKQRLIKKDEFNTIPYKIEILNDPGYNNTISLKRIYSQKIFANNLEKWLRNNPIFDLVYCAGPPAEGMLVSGEYALKNNIPFIIDVQDLWPEAMQTIINIPLIKDILFYPMKKQIDKAYSRADGIIAVSQTYEERVKSANSIYKYSDFVYIGTDIEKFDASSSQFEIQKNKREFWVTYAGSLNVSYDISTMIDALKILKDKGIDNLRMMVLGSGVLEKEFKKKAEVAGIKSLFTGWIEYGTMAAYLKKSDVLVNAIRKNAAQSITNKIGDYVSAGVPIVNGSPNKEFINLVKEWDIGYNYFAEDSTSMANAIEKVYTDTIERKVNMGCNSRKLAEQLFDRKKTYGKITEMISNLLI